MCGAAIDSGSATSRRPPRGRRRSPFAQGSVACKSVVTCSNIGLAKGIVRALKLRGVTMTAAKHTSYLGVDLGAGVRHAREQRVKRSAKHLVRHRKVV
eukprot:4851643-Pyramimonas_sp.AAC.1